MVKKRVSVETKPKARPMRRKVDHAEVYEDIKNDFRPCDIATKYQITDRMVRVIRAKYQSLDSTND